MRIRVEPDQLREHARRFRDFEAGLGDVMGRLSGAMGTLDWEARQRANVDLAWGSARARAADLLAGALALAQRLDQAATVMEDTDLGCATDLERLVVAFRADRSGWEHILLQHRPALPADFWRRWQLFVGAGDELSLWPQTRVPLTGGGELAGLLGLTAIGGLSPAFSDFAARVWAWLTGRVATGPLTPLPDEAHAPGPSTSFGALLDRLPATPPAVAPAGEAKGPLPSTGEERLQRAVPLRSQHGLLGAGGRETEYGCTPTAAAMILDYWHSRDPDHAATTPQALLDSNVAQGTFGPTGMSATDLHDELHRLGYSEVRDLTDSTADQLRAELVRGPVIAIVKLNMQSAGTNHAVVITGISADNQVQVNDPWTGTARNYAWDEFERSWGADFGPGIPRRNFIVIHP